MKAKVFFVLPAVMLAGCSSEQPSVSELSSDRQTPESTPSPSAVPSVTPEPSVKAVSITFDTQHMPTEASNQYAAWVEDSSGNLVKTLYVSSFTAERRGYTRRPDALNHRVEKAQPQNMSDAQIDAFSGTASGKGTHELSWDYTDQKGNRVPDGEYMFYPEGTLYWSGNVLFQGIVSTSGDPITVNETRSEPHNSTNETMVQNVTYRFTE